VLGLAYPLAFTGLAQLVAGSRADGSFVQGPDGAVVGSSLLGQAFEGPEWFHPRPSAAGEGYDALASGASYLGPNSEDLLTLIEERRAAVAAASVVDPGPRRLGGSGPRRGEHRGPPARLHRRAAGQCADAQPGAGAAGRMTA
jgi:potassium-transporting ATPase KdpC subunit